MVGLIQSIPRLKQALTHARNGDLLRIDESLRRFGVTGVLGEGEVGITSLIEATLRNSAQPVIRIDLLSATNDQDVAWLIAQDLARGVIGFPGFSLLQLPEGLRPNSAQQAFVRFANQVGERLAHFALAGSATDDVTVSEALEGVHVVYEQHVLPPALWIDHLETPALTPRHPLDVGRLLWNVRALAQRMEVPIVLSGHQTTAPLAFGKSGAFHGDGVVVTIGRPGSDVWWTVADALGPSAPPRTWISEMVELTHAHPATMLLAFAMLSDLTDHAHTPLELWQLMLSLDDGHTARAVQHARTLHRLGARILEQIAGGEGPYTHSSGTNVKEIHRAVRRLHEAALITQPRPRVWQVTNPLVAGRLRRYIPSHRGDAVGPEAYDVSGRR